MAVMPCARLPKHVTRDETRPSASPLAGPRWETLKGAAHLLQVDERTMRRMATSGRVYARKVGDTVWRVRIGADELPADPPHLLGAECNCYGCTHPAESPEAG